MMVCGHAVRAELEGRQRRPLVARPRLVHPHMQRHAALVRLVDRRQRRAAIDGGEPAGVAVGEDVDRLLVLLALGRHQDGLEAVLADAPVGLDVVLADLRRALVGCRQPSLPRQIAHRAQHLLQRPAQVDGGGALRGQQRDGAVDGLVGGVRAQRQANAVGGRGADQRRAAHLHGLNRARRVLDRLERRDRQLVRQLRLVDDLHRPAVRGEPDRAIGLAVDVHAAAPPARLLRPLAEGDTPQNLSRFAKCVQRLGRSGRPPCFVIPAPRVPERALAGLGRDPCS